MMCKTKLLLNYHTSIIKHVKRNLKRIVCSKIDTLFKKKKHGKHTIEVYVMTLLMRVQRYSDRNRPIKKGAGDFFMI